jgi:hypothetical protein
MRRPMPPPEPDGGLGFQRRPLRPPEPSPVGIPIGPRHPAPLTAHAIPPLEGNV